jgi:hypothetical protein
MHWETNSGFLSLNVKVFLTLGPLTYIRVLCTFVKVGNIKQLYIVLKVCCFLLLCFLYFLHCRMTTQETSR